MELTIGDDDAPPTAITLELSPTSVSEDGGTQQVAVSASLVGSARTVSTPVTVTVEDGTAVSGSDYAAVPGFTLTIAAEATSEAGTFSITPEDDNLAEDSETVTVRGTASGLGSATQTLTITDDDRASTGLELELSPASVSEGGGAQAVAVTASLNAAARTEATAVTVSVSDGTAASGSDYTAVDDFTLTIAAAASNGTGTFTITPRNDGVAEGAEMVTVTASAEDTTLNLSGDTAELTIDDDDPAPTGLRVR